MNQDIILKIDGEEFSGWQSLEVTKGMNQLAGSFSMSCANKNNLAIKMGKECTVNINGHTIVTGHIEFIDSKFNMNNHFIHVRGRDKLGDLVDCCFYDVDNPHTGEFLNQSIKTIIERLCKPYNVDVVVDKSVKDILDIRKDFAVETGETVAEAIVRLARVHAFIPVGYGDGKLTLTRSRVDDYTTTGIKVGENIKDGQLIQSDSERYKWYVVKGENTGFDYATLKSNSQMKQAKEDKLIDRHRATIILLEDNATEQLCIDRAEWEAKVRAGRSRQYMYTITGWLQKDGTPWDINKIVNVDDPINGSDVPTDGLLCSNVTFQLTESTGRLTRMTLVDKETYDVVKQPEDISTKYDAKKLKAALEG